MAERDSGRRSFWVTNRVANPLLRRLLRGPFGHRMGRGLAVLAYRGRRTGEVHELVVQYVRDGARVCVVVGRPERKRWWRSMVEPALVDLCLAGQGVIGIACVIDDRDQPDEVARAMAAYVKRFPRALAAADRSGAPPVMIQIDLTSTVVEDDLGASSHLASHADVEDRRRHENAAEADAKHPRHRT